MITITTSENAWHCGASVSEKLSVMHYEMFYLTYGKIHEQIEFCGEHIRILVLLNMHLLAQNQRRLATINYARAT